MARRNRLVSRSTKVKPGFGAVNILVAAGIVIEFDKKLEDAWLNQLLASRVDLAPGSKSLGKAYRVKSREAHRMETSIEGGHGRGKLARPRHIVRLAVAAISSTFGLTSCGASREDVATDAGITVEFSDLRVEEVGATRAVVRFRTSIATTCEVEFGLAPQQLDHSATDPSMSMTEPFAILHRVPLEDLTPAMTYYYRARATTPQGMAFQSDMQSFVTLQAGPSNLVNVALTSMGARVVERSSNYGGAADTDAWGAAAAFDGQMATEWATAGDGNGAYLVVDLGGVRHLQGAGFRSREMSDGTSIIRGFRLVIAGVVYGPFQSPDPAQRYSFDLAPPVDAQVVRFEAVDTTGGNTGAREIELMAAPP